MKHHETLLKHCETSRNTQTLAIQCNDVGSAFDVETLALGVETSVLGAATLVLGAAISVLGGVSGDIGAEFLAIA